MKELRQQIFKFIPSTPSEKQFLELSIWGIYNFV